MIKDIVIYPDKRLKLISTDVVDFNYDLHSLLDDMYDTMLANNGVGLAAIQIGIPLRALIINIPSNNYDPQPKSNTMEILNPIIIESNGLEVTQEGCLSVPGFYDDIKRSKFIKIEFFDRFGQKQTIENDSFLSIAIQHELDHLDGKVFIEKLSFSKRKKFEKIWKQTLK